MTTKQVTYQPEGLYYGDHTDIELKIIHTKRREMPGNSRFTIVFMTMKMILCSAILFLANSCIVDSDLSRNAPASAHLQEEMASQVVTALQHMSSEEYLALLPTLQEFHQMMEKSPDVYGEALLDAKLDFAAIYENKLAPAVKESFDKIIREGNKKGISWNTVRFEGIASSEETEFGHARLSIVFDANGKKYTLLLKKVLIVNMQWKATQFIELV